MNIAVLVEKNNGKVIVAPEDTRVLILSEEQYVKLLKTRNENKIDYAEVGLDITIKSLLEYWLKDNKKFYAAEDPQKAYLFD